MNRRVLLFGVILSALAFAGGYLSHKHEAFPYGVWSNVRSLFAAEHDGLWFVPADDPDQPHVEDKLGALGYAAGVRPAPNASGVVAHDPSQSSAGYNLFASGHGPEAVLMDMDGTVLHSWKRSIDDTWPDRDRSEERAAYWRRVRLEENGDLLVVCAYVGIARIDKDSKVVWAHAGLYHHDIHVLPDGRCFTLRRETESRPGIRDDEPSYDDVVVEFDADGNELNAYSVLEALENSPYSPVLRQIRGDADIFHTNSVYVLDDRLADAGPAFAPGNLLVCLRDLHYIAVIGVESREVEWMASGMWHMQHDARPTTRGTITLFDNQGSGKLSRVVEFDARTQAPVWIFGGTDDARFYSEYCGSAQALPNGNVLVTQSMAGRAFEVTRDGAVVWEYRNPFRAGDDRELIAVLFENERLPADFRIDWARGPADR